jgi:hypothetical protein
MNVTLLLMSILSVILITSFSSLTSGQGIPQPEYKTYVVDRCGVSLAYPSNWISEVKTGRFDLEHENELVVKDGLVGVPQFTVLPCIGTDTQQYTTLETLAGGLRDILLSSYHSDFKYSLVEDVKIMSSIIAGQDTAVIAFAEKYTNGDPNVSSELYVTQHNNLTYAFAYEDLAIDFDSIQSKNLRDKILHSIKFIR